MDVIYVECEFGHRSKADMKLAGKTLPCPKCQGPVYVPQPKDTLSDTGVMRILSDHPIGPVPTPEVFSTSTLPSRPCPRCQVRVDERRSMCPHCECYIGALPSFLEKLA